MDKLIDYICDELDEYEKKAEKGKLSMAEMQYVDLLAHTKKNLLKSDEMEGESYADDRMPVYRDGRRYAMARGRNARRDSRGRYASGRYSMDNDGMIDELKELMEDAPDEHGDGKEDQQLCRFPAGHIQAGFLSLQKDKPSV